MGTIKNNSRNYLYKTSKIYWLFTTTQHESDSWAPRCVSTHRKKSHIANALFDLISVFTRCDNGNNRDPAAPTPPTYLTITPKPTPDPEQPQSSRIVQSNESKVTTDNTISTNPSKGGKKNPTEPYVSRSSSTRSSFDLQGLLNAHEVETNGTADHQMKIYIEK